MRQQLKCIRYVLNPFSQILAGNTIIIGTDQTGLCGWGFEPTEEKRVKIYSGKKKKTQINLKALKCRWWCGENHFLSFFLYSRGTEMTAAGRSGSTKVQWMRRTGVHIKDSRLECVHTFLSFSLSLSFTLTQTCTHLSQTLIRQTNGRF